MIYTCRLQNSTCHAKKQKLHGRHEKDRRNGSLGRLDRADVNLVELLPQGTRWRRPVRIRNRRGVRRPERRRPRLPRKHAYGVLTKPCPPLHRVERDRRKNAQITRAVAAVCFAGRRWTTDGVVGAPKQAGAGIPTPPPCVIAANHGTMRVNSSANQIFAQ